MVLGPHRSGTSVAASSLVLGAGLCAGTSLLGANKDNPRGFFENARIVSFNDRLLKHLGLCWDFIGKFDSSILTNTQLSTYYAEAHALISSEFNSANAITIKDPRLCLLAPFWHRVLESHGFTVKYLLTQRHPVDSARSQQDRALRDPAFHFLGVALGEGIQLWAAYMHHALAFLQDHAAVVIDYNHFFEHTDTLFTRLQENLGLSIAPDKERLFRQSFLDPSLQHHRFDASNNNGADKLEFSSYFEFYDALSEVTAPGVLQGDQARRLAQQLESIRYNDPVNSEYWARIYVQARHTAVESQLSLRALRNEAEKARRIINHNEYQINLLNELKEHHINELSRVQSKLVMQRIDNQRLAIALAAAQDRINDLEMSAKNNGQATDALKDGE